MFLSGYGNFGFSAVLLAFQVPSLAMSRSSTVTFLASRLFGNHAVLVVLMNLATSVAGTLVVNTSNAPLFASTVGGLNTPPSPLVTMITRSALLWKRCRPINESSASAAGGGGPSTIRRTVLGLLLVPMGRFRLLTPLRCFCL